MFIVLKILVAKVRNLLGDHYMEDLSPRLKFQPGAGLKFCSDYVENLSPGLKIFSPVFFLFYMAGKFLAASRKCIQCLSFMFEQCTILMMLNAILIMYELLGRKKRFAMSSNICLKKILIQRQKFLRRRNLLRKPRSVWVARGSTDEWWNNVKQEDLPKHLVEKKFSDFKRMFI